jgi:hypothetical protein
MRAAKTLDDHRRGVGSDSQLKLVASTGPDELTDFERRQPTSLITVSGVRFATWDHTSLGDLRIAIRRRRRELTLSMTAMLRVQAVSVLASNAFVRSISRLPNARRISR